MRNPQPMMMMPFPFGMQQPQPVHHDSGFTDRIPARVIVAMRYIDNLAGYAKSEPVAVSSDVTTEIQIVPGQKLEIDQLRARTAACNLLAAYFAGDLKLADWETPPKDHERRGGSMIGCIACAGGRHRRPDGKPCELCGGANNLLVFPATPEEIT